MEEPEISDSDSLKDEMYDLRLHDSGAARSENKNA
jgi:hypothetical protein